MEISYSELTNSQLKEISDVFNICSKLGFFKQDEIFVELEKLNYLKESLLKSLGKGVLEAPYLPLDLLIWR